MSEAHPVENAASVYSARLAEFSDHEWSGFRRALTAVESADSFGSWIEPVQLADGSRQMPWAQLSEACEEFMRTLERLGLHIPFDWAAWDHGRTLARAPERLDRATPAEAAMLIFAIWRSNRFVEGELLEAFESGLIQRAARRVLVASTDHRD